MDVNSANGKVGKLRFRENTLPKVPKQETQIPTQDSDPGLAHAQADVLSTTTHCLYDVKGLSLLLFPSLKPGVSPLRFEFSRNASHREADTQVRYKGGPSEPQSHKSHLRSGRIKAHVLPHLIPAHSSRFKVLPF